MEKVTLKLGMIHWPENSQTVNLFSFEKRIHVLLNTTSKMKKCL